MLLAYQLEAGVFWKPIVVALCRTIEILRLHLIRSRQVVIQHDLARLYQVKTSALNRAAKRNEGRFPEDFRFRIARDELGNLRCQVGILAGRDASSVIGRTYLPYVYTEQGVAMPSAVLRSQVAIDASIRIMRAFVEMRHFVAGKRSFAVARIEDDAAVRGSPRGWPRPDVRASVACRPLARRTRITRSRPTHGSWSQVNYCPVVRIHSNMYFAGGVEVARMRRPEIQALAHNLLESGHVECDFIEYKRSDQQRDRILKTLCAFANNYMNRDVGLLYIGVQEEDGTAFDPPALYDVSGLEVLP